MYATGCERFKVCGKHPRGPFGPVALRRPYPKVSCHHEAPEARSACVRRAQTVSASAGVRHFTGGVPAGLRDHAGGAPVADQRATQALLQKALGVLEGFYGKKAQQKLMETLGKLEET